MPVKLLRFDFSLIIWSMVVLSYVFSYTTSVDVGYLNYALMFVGVIYKIMRDNVLSIPSYGDCKFFIYLYLIGFLIFPLIQTVYHADVYIVINIGLYLLFTIYIFQVVSEFRKKNKAQRYLISYFLMNIFVFLFQYFQNPSQLFNLRNYLYIFNQSFRTNYDYGFLSSNNLGGLCFGAIVCFAFINKKILSRKLKILLYSSFIFVIAFLLNTGSRTAVSCVGLFYLFRVFFVFRTKFKFKRKSALSTGYFLSVVYYLSFVGLFGVIYVFSSYSFEELNRISSNRLEGWVHVFEYIGDNYLFIGGGLLNPSILFKQRFEVKLIADNWYMFMFIAYGIVGFLISLSVVLYFVYRCSKYRTVNPKAMVLLVSFVIVKIFYSMFEISFYTPSDLTSLLMIVLVFAYNKEDNSFKYLSD